MRNPSGPLASLMWTPVIRALAAHNNDMQRPRPMRAEDDLLLDVARAGRTGDQVHRARHLALPIAGSDPAERSFEVAVDVVGIHYHDMVLRQEIDSGRVAVA